LFPVTSSSISAPGISGDESLSTCDFASWNPTSGINGSGVEVGDGDGSGVGATVVVGVGVCTGVGDAVGLGSNGVGVAESPHPTSIDMIITVARMAARILDSKYFLMIICFLLSSH